MNTMQMRFRGDAQRGLLSIALVALLAGCGQSSDTNGAAGGQPVANQPAAGERPLGQVTEFDGFTLRANVGPTGALPDTMARQYGIDVGPEVFLLNLVVLQKRPNQQPVAVPAEVSAHYASLVGHTQAIDMRLVEADGNVSYIGTLDTSAQRVFRFVIEAQPAGIAQPLSTNFEVQLPALGAN